MSGCTAVYLEKPRGDGAWVLVEESGKPKWVAVWNNRVLHNWLVNGESRDLWGAPPLCKKGIPDTASRRLKRYVEKQYFRYEELAWMHLSDLVALLHDEGRDLEVVGVWIRKELEPGLRRAGFKLTDQLRLILATD